MKVSWKNTAYKAVSISQILFSAYIILNMTQMSHLFVSLVFLVTGIASYPRFNDRIQDILDVELPSYNMLVMPIVAILIMLFVAVNSSSGLYYSDFSEKEIKQNSTNMSEIGYNELIRNSDEYEYDLIYYEGEVTQVMNQDGGYAILIATGGSGYLSYTSNYVWTDYSSENGEMEIGGSRPVKGDLMKVWAEYTGPYQYETAIGSTNTVPYMALWHAERANQTSG